MSRKGIWDQVRLILEQGMVPEITVTPATRVKLPVGRPANLPEEKNFRHYAGFIRGRKSRPYCYRRGCGKQLRVNEILVCSDIACLRKVVEDAWWVLSVTGQGKIRMPLFNPEALPDVLKKKLKMPIRSA
jgi:hypothetical protein